ncbi:DNA-binding protein [Gulosibacter sp. 10]|uniref:DNA-binding protein n=1 Tax=Gulosibacter sp. 10 TaxID=1255570 RepID=UPI00097F58F8|nr:DNA-binding protein [Gulosibacter sp. 10]SJM71548.1 hypothetical protein FM112_16460 [Gulosibacter sp. 10]
MEDTHDLERSSSADRARADAEKAARDRLLELGADRLEPRPWRPSPAPPAATDLAQYALWRSGELASGDILSALSLLPAAREEADGVELGLLFAARGAGLTWAQIAGAMGFRSPQACQQYAARLGDRRGERA